MSTADPVDARAREDRTFFLFNAVVSMAALALLAWLLLLRRGGDGSELDLRFMPSVNAILNGTAATLLTAGWVAIRRGHQGLHKRLMVGAFVASTLFLVGYLAYHYVHGDTRYVGEHRGVYLFVLFSHIVLSIPVVPLALSAFYFAWRRRFSAHKKITRVLAPMWLYVSVTGVVVYFFLRGAAPAIG
ncbi:MAG: DUF420 domain-containing protein [Myxococcales bacterium]|nr:DUF420 domain-containing protein [Myxococcales bacterium]